jgi:hypothetical protein
MIEEDVLAAVTVGYNDARKSTFDVCGPMWMKGKRKTVVKRTRFLPEFIRQTLCGATNT